MYICRKKRCKEVISIIIPSYNEQDNIPVAAQRVSSLMQENNIDYEIVFVNDGSKDKTWERITEESEKNCNIVGVNFSRNFGKESAIFAGLKYAKGDACVLIDCDMQHPPEVIVDMYKIWSENDVDVVEGRKASRGKESFLYKMFAKLFYGSVKKSSGIDMSGASDFKLLDRKVVDALNEMPERLTFFRAMSGWVGFKTEKVYFDVAERNSGESKWSVKSLIKYAINSITSFTSAPLHAVTVCGLIMLLVSVIMAVNTLYNKLSGNSLEGFTTVILLQLFTSSVIMISLGVIGYYISKIYEEIKQRPRYIVSEVIRNNSEEEK
ncbi:MAG: glycosyltransferase [Oscillospiraceae bacterium]|nr:glycosyltransferase [Oscillospiraceae bacterium]